jgi:hypothetical protein
MPEWSYLVVGNLEEDELPGAERIQQSEGDRRDHGAEEARKVLSVEQQSTCRIGLRLPHHLRGEEVRDL